MKAFNMKKYKFGTTCTYFFTTGFGMYDEETKTFVSVDGKVPYVLGTKKLAEACIAAGYQNALTARIAHK